MAVITAQVYRYPSIYATVVFKRNVAEVEIA
jgi:hypothetical protein